MRRSITALTLLSSLALVACEDGPSQVYAPSPNGAGGVWNNGVGDAAVDDAHQGFDNQGGGTNKVELCNGDKKHKVWADLVTKPVMPPSKAAGLDLSGGDSWNGLTIDEADKINCQSDVYGDGFGNGTLVNTWGDNGEVWFNYRVSTRKGIGFTLNPGYQGTIEATSPDGAHTFSFPINTQVRKDGKPLTLDWTGSGGKNFVPVGDEIYRAMIHTFAPFIAQDAAGVTCFDTGRCIKGSFGDIAYFYIPALGSALWVGNQNAAQPAPSTLNRLDQDLAKIMAYSFAQPTMKMDAEGPVAKAGVLKPGTPECVLKFGLKFGDFQSNCVQTTGDATKDKTELNKLFGGLSHNTERFGFDLHGVDVNFTASTVSPMDIVHDLDTPVPADTATEFRVDQSTLGNIQNDRDAAGKRDLHGAGAVYKEYARLVRSELLNLTGVTDGDVSKCQYPVGYAADPTFDPQAFLDTLPAYCTGFEGFITVGTPSGAKDFANLGYPTGATIAPGGLTKGLKPGHQKVVICMDANGDATGGYANCTGGDTFSTSFSQVLKVMGKGRVASLPTEVQDVRFFWKQWFKAFAKYMTVADQAVVPDLATVVIDPDQLFFDSVGAGQFEIAEYVDRRFASKTQDPTDLNVSADVKNGIFSTYEFSRDLYRGETAMYAATLVDQKHGIGQENSALLSNLFGSPVLNAAYTPSSKGKTAYYCATTVDAKNCDGQSPPSDATGAPLLDELGRPILYGYPGAFAGGATKFALGPTASPPSATKKHPGITVDKTFDTIQEALITVPITADPYDYFSAPGTPLQVLVPWAPKQPGIGFHVALNGGIDKFVTTSQIDLSGTTITANIDYDVIIDPTTGKPQKDGGIQFLAVETTDFLGDVFVCQDAASGDILRARMYTPVATLLNWFESHPGSYANCQIIIRYSPFGNYADYITSLTGGVRLNITQGGGFGRVVDATVFVPGQ